MLHRREVRPRDGKWSEDIIHLKRVMFRPCAFYCSEFQLDEHLERDKNFTGWVVEEFY